MSESAARLIDAADHPTSMLEAAARIVHEDLKPLTLKIDLEGLYPQAVMHQLGAAGAFRPHLPAARADGAMDMPSSIKAMSLVSQECLSTGFSMWCQDTCGWYLQNAVNSSVRENWVGRLAEGHVLGGTGMSNTMKAFAGIEELRLRGKRVDGGYVVNGSLPWVSNLGAGHVFGTLFDVEGEPGRSVMALVDCDTQGFQLRLSAHFTALEGTRTFACIFQEAFIPDAMIIDDDGAAFLRRSRAGIVLLQLGMGLGVVQSCIDICRDVEPMLGHVNCYLEDRPDELQLELDDTEEASLALAEDAFEESDDYFREVLQLRLTSGELALRAAQSAMLHTGAKGYLQSAPAQRKLREAYFVAIVTPAIKHLRKELAEMDQAS
ncbi:MAG: acyl-CoA/acyl-ACP dehydrogenase [Acidihalobacter sp.]|uniref:acyl-CoA dehydrogenase family protein n=1 Tax=Acidihalobacter sp. TaxID=1872108 RepID=UPI00307E890D